MDMKKDILYQWRLKQAATALEDVARQEGVSVEEVYREIEWSIQEGWNHQDPFKRALFRQIPCVGEVPTPEELIAYGVTVLREYEE